MSSKQATFDIVSKIDEQEVKNAINQADREIKTRFDLKGTKSEIRLEPDAIVLLADDEIKLAAIDELLAQKLAKRSVPLEALEKGSIEPAAGGMVRMRIALQQGIPIEKAREMVKIVKNSKLKVQAQVQEDQVRVMGKNKDDLQAVMRLLKEAKLGVHMQFVNYRS
jgi:cyclic-di-GMP-binding protein